LRQNFPALRNADIDASFYPYVGLTHTIRRKGCKWIVRISDHCRHAPVAILESIIMMLGCKIMRRSPSRTHAQAYAQFRNNPHILESVRERRMSKGKKQIAGEHGRYHSLRELYKELNESYFNDQIEIHKIGWGLRKSRARLGHYDPVHHTITLSPLLDSAAVPRYVVRYIVYHEMLHAVFEGHASGRARRHHPAEFRRAERSYPDYAKARKFLQDHGNKLR
jgi:predicted metal-dependent hydrolase